jgi:hypothetical protein
MASKLILTRKAEWINRRQRFKVFINDKEAGLIKNDDTQEYELEPGTYTVQCKLNWTSSLVYALKIKQGTNAFLTVSNGMKYIVPLYIMMLVGVLIPFFLRLAKLPMSETINIIKIILIVPAIVYILLYATVFRKKYLYLGEDKSNPFK